MRWMCSRATDARARRRCGDAAPSRGAAKPLRRLQMCRLLRTPNAPSPETADPTADVVAEARKKLEEIDKLMKDTAQ